MQCSLLRLIEVTYPTKSHIELDCNREPTCSYLLLLLLGETSPPKFRLDGASVAKFRGFSFVLMTEFLLLPYDLSLSSNC